jgi:hypothetical protein
LIQGVHSVEGVPLADSGDAAILAVINSRSPTAAASVRLFAECAPGVDVAIDSRPLVRQTSAPSALSTIAHTGEASWANGYLVSVFQAKALVLAFVVPVGSGTGGSAAACGVSLTAIEMPDLDDCAAAAAAAAAADEAEPPAADEAEGGAARGKKKARC